MRHSGVFAVSVVALGFALGNVAYAACPNCGTVSDVRTVTKKGEGTGLGLVAGGVLGGVLGNQVGGGRGRDLATVAGAAGGAYAGHQTEKNMRSKQVHQVVVRLESGRTRTFSYGSDVGYRVGDHVKVVNNRLVRN